MYEQAALGDAPLRPRVVDVELALALEHERLLRGGRREREAVPDLCVGRVQVEVQRVQRRYGQDQSPRLDVERRGSYGCARLRLRERAALREDEGGLTNSGTAR